MTDISFIIPVYNTEKEVLERCIKSICNHEYENFEIIIVDDGSKKEYQEIFRDIENIDRRIKVLHKENGGASSARNYGTTHARGDYISYVDADDQLAHCFFEGFKQVKDKEIAFIIGGNSNKEVDDRIDMPDVEVLQGINVEKIIPNMISEFIYFGDGYYIGRGPWSRVIKRSVAQKHHFDESLVVGEDICWNIDVIRESEQVGILKLPWYIYTIEQNSVTRKFNPNAVHNAASGIQAVESRIDSNNCNQYEALLKRFFEEIERLYRISHSVINRDDMMEIEKRVYDDKTWSHIIDELSFKPQNKRIRIKILLYKRRFLFKYFKLKYK